MAAFHLEMGQVWGVGRMKMRHRRIILIAGYSVMFQIEGKEGTAEHCGISAFQEWIKSNGAVLLKTDIIQHGHTVSDRIIGERLRAIRVGARLSQDEIAERVGLSRTAIALWETGRRGCSLKRLGDVAEALGISALDLLRQEAKTRSGSVQLEERLLTLFRNVDSFSREEVLRWLERRVETSVDQSNRSVVVSRFEADLMETGKLQ
ncbi:helix-turn-helix domain-containing protein [Acetobacter aceti]|uniref:helix-turn-helix domain-containing protein n=1 Tax=Acetobacter aceti TaxID=435 RepID=UPI000C077B55|nr:helix-turn-helix transcriptional regulator [Acetobacter aceti]